MGVSLCRGPVGEPGEGVHLQGTVRDSGRRALEMEHLSQGSYDGGVYVWKKVLGWVSLHIGALLGNCGGGSVYRELLKLAEGGL